MLLQTWNLSNIVIFIFDRLLAVVGHVSFALKQKMLRVYYFLLKRKKLLRQPNTNGNRCNVSLRIIVSHRPYRRLLRWYPVLQFAFRGNFGFPLRSSGLRDWSAYNRGDRSDYASEYRVKLLERRRRARHYERPIKRNVRAGNMWPSLARASPHSTFSAGRASADSADREAATQLVEVQR